MSMFFESAYTLNEEMKANPLPPMGINSDTITFAGESGGSYMSTNMHIIHSDVVKAAGLMVGGPYGFDWLGFDDTLIPPNAITDSYDLVAKNYAAGLIDNPKNLKDSAVMIISGSIDTTIPHPLQLYLK